MTTQKQLLDQDKIYQGQALVSDTDINVGEAAAGVAVAVEHGNDVHHQAVIDINTTLGAIAGGAALGLGKKIYDLPAGAVIVSDSYMSIAITQTQGHINANTPVVGLGSVVASGAVSALSGTSTFEDIMTGQTAANCTGTPTVKTITKNLVKEVAAARAVYLNVAATWAASGDAAAIVTGRVVLNYKFMN